MIRLDIQPYCSECCDFSPDVIAPTRMYADSGTITQTDTIVRCGYAKRCEAIKRYLSKCMEDET